MKTTWLFAALIFGASVVMAQDHSKMKQDSSGHTMVNNSTLKWVDGPPGLPPGAKLAVLSGDPSQPGIFTIRLMFPANYAVKPHWHPTAENITVVEGTMFMGTQKTFDKQQAGKLEKGGFAVMPAKFVHYAFCEAPAVVQIHGTGPFAIHYVDPNDDPRNQAKAGSDR